MNGRVELLTVRAGEPAYDALLGPVRADPALMRQVWEDSESRVPEEPGKVWCIAAVDGVAAAWAAAYETEMDGRPVLRCVDSYERPGPGRELSLYAAAYALRHQALVLPAADRGVPALTYIFAKPLRLHLADGWQVTDEDDSHEPDAPSHHWFELWRPAA